MSAKCFKALYGFCAATDERVERDDCALGFSDKIRAKLCQMLGEDYYTYLVLHDALDHEIVRLEQSHGLLSIHRAQDDTDKQAWPCGTLVKFDWVPSAITDAKIEKVPEKCPEELFTGKIKNGNCTVHFKDGLAYKETVNKRQIQDGCYEEPVITYKNGCVTEIAEGTNGHLPPPGCCG